MVQSNKEQFKEMKDLLNQINNNINHMEYTISANQKEILEKI